MWTQLPIDLHQRLVDVRFESVQDFRQIWREANCGPNQLASRENLVLVFDLLLKIGDEESWRWLAQMMPLVVKLEKEMQEEVLVVAPLAHAVLGYILAAFGNERAKEELEVAYRGFRELAKKYEISPSEWALIGLGWAKLGEYDAARMTISFAVKERFSRTVSYCPPNEAACFRAYRDLLPASRALNDLLYIFRTCRHQMQRVLFYPGRRLASTLAFVEIWYDALGALRRPFAWANDLLQEKRTGYTRWTVTLLFFALARTSRIEETFQLWNLLKTNEFTIPSDASSKLAAALLEAGSPDRALEVYSPISTSHAGLSRMLVAFTQANMIDNAKDVLHEITERFTPSRNDCQVLPRFAAAKGDVKATKGFLAETYGPNVPREATQIMIYAYCGANDALGAEECLRGILPSIGEVNTILDLYADRVEPAPAVKLFNRLLDAGIKPNVKTYTAVISLFAKLHDMDNVERLLEAMHANGVEPDGVLWAAVLNAEIGHGEWINAAKRWESFAPQIKAEPAVSAAILRAFVYVAAPTDLVMSLFRQLDRPGRHQWALAVQSACDNGDLELARDLYEEMDDRGDPKPDIYTMTILLHGYLRVNVGDSARLVYDEMLNRNLIPSSITYALIIRSFTAAQSQQSLEQGHDFAMSILKQAKEGKLPEVGAARAEVVENVLTPLVIASGQMRQPEASKAYFDLGSNGRSPSIPYWSSLLDAYRRAGNVVKVLETWKAIFVYACEVAGNGGDFRRSQSNILCIPLSMVLDTLSSDGRHAEVMDAWKSVRDAGFGFDSGNYNHYAVALARTGDLQSAFHVIERVVIPRWDEVRQRRDRALREEPDLPALAPQDPSDASNSPDSDPIKIDDTPVNIPYAPPSRREAFRFDNPFGSDADKNPESVAHRLLQTWRPSDILWRPSLLTMAILDQAYRDVEMARRMSQLATTADETEKDDDVEGVDRPSKNEEIPLESFGHVHAIDPDGERTRFTAATLLSRLNRRYPRTVKLLAAHRKRIREKESRDRYSGSGR